MLHGTDILPTRDALVANWNLAKHSNAVVFQFFRNFLFED